MKQAAPEHPFFFSAVGGTDAAPGGVTGAGAGVLGVNGDEAAGGTVAPVV